MVFVYFTDTGGRVHSVSISTQCKTTVFFWYNSLFDYEIIKKSEEIMKMVNVFIFGKYAV